MHKASPIKTRPRGRKRRGRSSGSRGRRRKEIGRQTKRADAPNGLVAHGEIRFATEQCIYTCCTRDTEVPTSLPAIHLHARSSHAARRRVIFTIIIKCMFLPLRAGRMPLHWSRGGWFIRTISFIEKPVEPLPSSFFPYSSLSLSLLSPPLFYLESSIRYWRTGSSSEGRIRHDAISYSSLLSKRASVYFSTDIDNTTFIPGFLSEPTVFYQGMSNRVCSRDEKHGITKIYLTWVVVEVGGGK